MDKILIVFGIAAVALVCAIIVKKARREFSFAPDAHAATDERKLPAPDKTAILRRTQCVGVLVRRGLAEIALAEGQGDAAIHLAAVKALEKWTRARGLHGGFGTYELDLITGLAGTWGTEDARWAVRGTEGLGCLCWALSLLREMPPYDKSFDVAALLGYLHAGEENFDLIPRHHPAHLRRAAARAPAGRRLALAPGRASNASSGIASRRAGFRIRNSS